MDLDSSDKENCAPSGADAHLAPIPLNSKGNIVRKQAARDSHDERRWNHSNTARKRQRLQGLSNTPPRPSYTSQMSRIFAERGSARRKEAEGTSPHVMSEDSIRLFNHFHQALGRTANKEAAKPRHGEPTSSDESTASEDGGNAEEDFQRSAVEVQQTHDRQSTLQRPPSETLTSTSGVANDMKVWPPDLYRLQSHQEPSRPSPESASARPLRSTTTPALQATSEPSTANVPSPAISDLERAIAASFPPTPSREQRRKTLHIEVLRDTPEADVRKPSSPTSCSTDSWTGDETFFPRPRTGGRVNPLAARPSPPAIPLLSPLRAVRPNRFHVPAVRSPIAQGVPLCMEAHPESVGSDADDESEGEGSVASER